MGFDLDRFDDIFPDGAVKNARAGGKFQPKAKARPRKEASASVPSTESVQTVITADNVFIGRNENEPFGNSHVSGDINGDWQSCFEKSEGENADIFIGLESLDSFLPQSTTVTETPTVHVSDDGNAEERLVDPDLCNTANACIRPERPVQLDTLSDEEAAIFNSRGDFHIENRATEPEDAEDFPCLETLDTISELRTRSGQRIGKFLPKPKVQIRKVKQSAMVPDSDAIESVLRPQDTHLVPSQPEYMDGGSIPSLPADDVLDFSSIRFSDSIPTDASSDFQMNEEPTNLMGTSHSDAAIPGKHPDAVSEMPGKMTKMGNSKIPMEPGPSLEHQKSSTSCPVDQAGRSSRRLRKRMHTFELVNESEDEALDDENVLENEDNDNNDREYVVENEPLNERIRSRSKKPVAEKEKPVRKHKKANEVSVESTKAPIKKFSHSTRRNKRRVNPDLLKTPEDEIDMQNLPMKDMIWLAEYRERMSKNEATTSETPLKNQSGASFSAYYDEDEAFASTQGGDSADEHENSMVQDSSTYFNYRTHMKITPRARWSKQDTELFFEAVQQFGTDLSMIAQRFPGRTREQIKKKYKTEERRHPLRLHDALTTRATDHSHFQVVIEQLQAQRQDCDIDGPIDSTGEGAEEVAADTNEEMAKSEQFEDEAQDMEPDVPAVETSAKSDDSEDDFYRWSQYKSEI